MRSERCNNCGAIISDDTPSGEEARCARCGARLFLTLRRLNRRAAEERLPQAAQDVEYRRAHGGSVCGQCQQPYRKHPYGGPLGMGDRQFLRRLCSGELVKL